MATSEHPASPLSVSPLAAAFGGALPPELAFDGTQPFPRIVADIDGNGWPWWAARAITGHVLWLATPQLPVTFTWATEADPIDAKHVVLDEAALAELLYSSALTPGVHSRTELAQTVEARLYAFRCQVSANPSHNERHRLADCQAWAAQLTGVSS